MRVIKYFFFYFFKKKLILILAIAKLCREFEQKARQVISLQIIMIEAFRNDSKPIRKIHL